MRYHALVPSGHQVAAAFHVASLVGPEGTKQVALTASFTHTATGGVFSTADLERGRDLLIRSRLLSSREGNLRRSPRLNILLGLPQAHAIGLALLALLDAAPPTWAAVAIREDGISDELIPDDDARALAEVWTDPLERERALIALGSRFDPRALEAAGEAAEIAVVMKCRRALERLNRPDLASTVQRVSEISDQLGYDVLSPTLSGDAMRLEVKSGSAQGDGVECIITRNEVSRGLADPTWALVFCHARSPRIARVLGWCDGAALRGRIPVDRSVEGRWMSARIRIDRSELRPGLPSHVRGVTPPQVDRG